MFICAGAMEQFPFAKPIGIGLIDSAIRLTRLILREQPSLLLFLGSAGSYDDKIPELTIFESFNATNIELSFLANQSYTPINNAISAEDLNVSHETKTAIVNSSNYITTDSRAGKLMIKMGITLENMEFYSVLSVAKEFHLPARGIFCVTNHTDSAAHETFIKRHAEAMKLLDSYVRTHYAEYL